MKKIIYSFFVLLLFSFVASVSAISYDPFYLLEVEGTSFLPSSVYAGDVVSVAIDVYNKGSSSSIKDLNGILDLGNQFEAVDIKDNIDLIKAGSTKTFIFKFKVKQDTVAGYYPIYLEMDYIGNEKFVEQSYTVNIPVSTTEKNIDVTVEPRIINPSSQTELRFTLSNISGTAISNVSFSWSEENNLILPLGSNNKRYVNLIEVGQLVELSYTVAADPNIATGIYPIDVTISFLDSNGSNTLTSQVGLIIGGKTDFEMSAEIVSTGQLSISIANIGSNDAEAVIVKIPSQQGMTISGSTLEILGNLNKGDFTIANFDVGSQQASLTGTDQSARPSVGIRIPGLGGATRGTRTTNDLTDSTDDEIKMDALLGISDGQLSVEISYTDTTGERQVVTKTVPLASGQIQQTFAAGSTTRTAGLGLFPLAAAALISAGALAFNRLKKRVTWKELGLRVIGIIVLFIAVIFLLQSDIIAVLLVTVASIVYLWLFLRKK